MLATGDHIPYPYHKIYIQLHYFTKLLAHPPFVSRHKGGFHSFALPTEIILEKYQNSVTTIVLTCKAKALGPAMRNQRYPSNYPTGSGRWWVVSKGAGLHCSHSDPSIITGACSVEQGHPQSVPRTQN